MAAKVFPPALCRSRADLRASTVLAPQWHQGLMEEAEGFPSAVLILFTIGTSTGTEPLNPIAIIILQETVVYVRHGIKPLLSIT
jgi:hypothetical protein